MGHMQSIESLQLHPVKAVTNLRIWLEHDWWGLSVFLTLKGVRFLHYNMSVKTWFKAATSLFVCYHEKCDVCNPLFEWINTPPFKYVIKISIMHVMLWGKHGETWKKLLFSRNWWRKVFKQVCKHLKCGNLHNNNASISEPYENL